MSSPKLIRAPWRARGVITTLVVCLFALTGCLKVDVDLSVRDDDTVEGTLVAAVRVEAVKMLGPGATDSFVSSLLEDVPGASHARSYDHGGFVGKQVHVSEVPLKKFEIPGDSRARAPRLAMRHVSDRYMLTGHWRLPLFYHEQLTDGIDQSILDSASFMVKVNFPGRIIDHNGRLEGRTVIWNLEPGHRYQLHAEAVESDSARIALIVFLACLVITLIVAALLFVQLRRHSIGRESAATEDREPPSA